MVADLDLADAARVLEADLRLRGLEGDRLVEDDGEGLALADLVPVERVHRDQLGVAGVGDVREGLAGGLVEDPRLEGRLPGLAQLERLVLLALVGGGLQPLHRDGVGLVWIQVVVGAELEHVAGGPDGLAGDRGRDRQGALLRLDRPLGAGLARELDLVGEDHAKALAAEVEAAVVVEVGRADLELGRAALGRLIVAEHELAAGVAIGDRRREDQRLGLLLRDRSDQDFARGVRLDLVDAGIAALLGHGLTAEGEGEGAEEGGADEGSVSEHEMWPRSQALGSCA